MHIGVRTSADTDTARYGAALALLLAAYVMDGIDKPGFRLASSLLVITLLLAILWAPDVRRSTRILAIALMILSAAASILLYSVGDSAALVSAVTDALVLATATVIILRSLRLHRTVRLSTVLGAFVGYALLAFTFGSVYRSIAAVTDEPFFNQGSVPEGAFLYFSLITITTVGFGDLTPGTELAQRLVAVEALVGQIFLVVVVARLVSLWGTAPPWKDDAAAGNQPATNEVE